MVQFTQYVAVQWSEMQFKSSMNTQKNHFDLKCMMIVDGILEIQTSNYKKETIYFWNGGHEQWMMTYEGSKLPERQLPCKKEEGCEYPR